MSNLRLMTSIAVLSVFVRQPANAEAQVRPSEDPLGSASWITSAPETNALEQAEWLWVALPGQAVPTTEAAPIGVVRLRAELMLAESLPTAATLWVAADNFARIVINGKTVGESTQWWNPLAIPVGTTLVPGRNVIEIEARNDAGQAGASNHCMLGHVIEWFYGWVLGIRQAPDSIGWREILIAPEPGELEWCRGRILTPRGPVECDWEWRDGQFLMRVTVPTGSTARVVLPTGCSDHVVVDGSAVQTEPGLFGRPELVLSPGEYRLRARQY